MASAPKDLSVTSLRGGMNNQDPAVSLAEDQCVLAMNVEFFQSTLGERRNGCETTNITGSGITGHDAVVHLSAHLPSDTEIPDGELWAISATEDTSVTVSRRSGTTWSVITPPTDLDPTFPTILQVHSQSLHGKLFIAARLADNTDRLMVWDGTALRFTGLTAPTLAPVVVDEGSGTFSGDRLYRVRFIEKSGTTILRRSEPSPDVTFTPSGTGAGATITRPDVVNEGETHWELEASDGDGNFWRIATIAIGTTTYNDETQPATLYSDLGPLSEPIGDYSLIESVRFIKADQDRLIVASSWENDEHRSRVSWTPVRKSTGAGNDERIPVQTDNFLDLDWHDGGDITGMSDSLSGSFYVFKYSRIYKLQRTGQAAGAYQAITLSKARGAIPGSIISGTDEFGNGCIYFLDPSIGPSRVTNAGIQYLRNMRGTWLTANTIAAHVSAHGVYYPDKQQVKWWIAVDGGATPSLVMVLQVNEIKQESAAAYDSRGRGWSQANGLLATAWCSCIVPERVVNDQGSDTLNFRPYIGLATPHYIQRTDVGFDDNGTPFIAKIVTRPYFLAGLLNRWGAMNAALLAQSINNPDTKLSVKFIRNYGTEDSEEIITDFVPDGDEEAVIRFFDSLHMSDAKAIQIQFSDPE